MSVKSHYVLFRGVFLRSYILLKRYIVNTVMQIGSIYMFFLLIFVGGKAVAGQALADSLGGIIVGFFLFTMTITAFSGLAQNLMQESTWGTLEQLYMSPFGIGRVVSIQTAANLLWSLIWGSVMLLLMMATTDRWLSVDLVTIVPVGVLTLGSAIGVGFALAGFALLYKRINAVFQLINFAFVGLIAAPVEKLPLLKYLPLSLGSFLLRRAMQDGVSLFEMAPADVATLAGVAAVYLGLGYGVFTLCQRRARKLGVLGDY